MRQIKRQAGYDPKKEDVIPIIDQGHYHGEKPFVPNPKVFFGDYISIAAVKGKVVPVWVRSDLGKTSLWTA